MVEKITKKPELLIPAGGMDTLKVAIDYGADAVYMGGQKFGLRAKADNFSIEEMKEAVRYVHAHGKKVYVTVNIFAHNDDIEGVKEYFETIHNEGLDRGDTAIDALLISDFGIFTLAKEILPDIDIHISTQANNTNYMTYNFWYKQGAKRVVAARELSLNELKKIRDNIPEDMEIEAFMHGAMCISYSGRCLLSSYFTGRDANKGACTHPCRWKYAVVEEKRPGEYLPVEEDERGTYIFNSKDLCMIEYIPEMIAAGIDSFKVEGRMKTALYVAAVTRTYRKAIDDYYESEELYRANMDYYKEEIAACTYRQFTTGFYFHKPDENTQIYDNNTYVNNYIYLGCVEEIVSNKDGLNDDRKAGGEVKLVMIHQKNKFSVGEKVSVMSFDGSNIDVIVEGIYDEKMNPMESAPHPKQLLYIKFNDLNGIKPGMIIRVKRF
ncbi:MAG: U32 family peptidase [Lachnospiraceae bacterium]|nr:U32 family peptidase [Lachnospiraceae bacterium]